MHKFNYWGQHVSMSKEDEIFQIMFVRHSLRGQQRARARNKILYLNTSY